jgi:hypothetical protein
MTVLLSAMSVTFAGFCVWLGVRIVNRRERWAKRTAAGLFVFVLTGYPLSFGPACWITARYGSLYPEFFAAYKPLISAADKWPEAWKILIPYMRFGLPENGKVLIKHGNALKVYKR